MRKVIKRDGNSLKIRIDVEDVVAYDLHVGDIVEINIAKVQSNNQNDKGGKN